MSSRIVRYDLHTMDPTKIMDHSEEIKNRLRDHVALCRIFQ